jgi:predicted transcriptional regulator
VEEEKMNNSQNHSNTSQITAPLTKDQLDLIRRFKDAYNDIDRYLRKFLQVDNEVPFSRLVRDYATRYPRWRCQGSLLMLSDLRNVLVHLPEKEYAYISIPTNIAIETIENIRNSFLSPELVYPRFQRIVAIANWDDSLAVILEIINKEKFSQFPVYKTGKCIGLLTENGITRWLAQHTVRKMTLVEFSEEPVEAILSQEEKRKNYGFIGRSTTVLEAENLFVSNPLLEALLITEQAKPENTLVGIITRWDIFS